MESVSALAAELVRCDTQNPPGNEAALARLLADRLAAVGAAVELQPLAAGRANLIATRAWGSDGPHLLLVGHLDTVEVGAAERWSVPPLAGVVRDGRLIARGAADMKGGLAAMVHAFTALPADAPLAGRLSLVGLCDEEGTHAGARHALDAGLTGDWAIVGEPTGLVPVIAAKGNALVRVELHGRAAHGSTPERGVNAIAALAPVLTALAAHADALRAEPHPLTGPPTLNVGVVAGGVSPWTVPDACELLIDRRLPPGEDAAAAAAAIAVVVGDALARHGDGCRWEVALERSIPAVELPTDSPVVEALRVARRERGQAPRELGWAASSDASILSGHGGIPCVLCGPGDLATQAHQVDESIGVAELEEAAALYRRVAELLLGGRA